MNTILYTQNESANQKNTIIVDEIVYSEMTSGIAYDAFKLINKQSSEPGNWIWVINRLKAYGIIKSKNFKFCKSSSGIFIRACFQEKDELGRNMPFMFYAKTTNIDDVCSLLIKDTAKIKRSCFENELKILHYLSEKFVYGGIFISFILLCYILWKIAN